MKINGEQPTEGIQVELDHTDITDFIAKNPDYVTNLLGTDIGQKALQPKLDTHFSKSLETWKANNLEKIVKERVEALYPNETPEARQLKEMQRQITEIQGEKVKAEMTTKTLEMLSGEGLPNSFAKFLQGNDEVLTRQNINEFKFMYEQQLNGSVESKFKQFGHQPQTNVNNTVHGKDVQIDKLSYSERMKMMTENPNEYSRLMAMDIKPKSNFGRR